MASYTLPNTVAGGSVTVQGNSLADAQSNAASQTGASLSQQQGGGTFGSNSGAGMSSGNSGGGGGGGGGAAPVAPGNQDLAGYVSAMQASSGLSIKQLTETAREFDATLAQQQAMWKQQGLPQLAIQQQTAALEQSKFDELKRSAVFSENLQTTQQALQDRIQTGQLTNATAAQELANRIQSGQLAVQQDQQALATQIQTGQLALNVQTEADTAANQRGTLGVAQGQLGVSQGQLGLDTLKTAASLTGPQNWIQAANFSRGVAGNSSLPGFMNQLLSGQSTAALGGPAAGAMPSAPNTLQSLASGMGANGQPMPPTGQPVPGQPVPGQPAPAAPGAPTGTQNTANYLASLAANPTQYAPTPAAPATSANPVDRATTVASGPGPVNIHQEDFTSQPAAVQAEYNAPGAGGAAKWQQDATAAAVAGKPLQAPINIHQEDFVNQSPAVQAQYNAAGGGGAAKWQADATAAAVAAQNQPAPPAATGSGTGPITAVAPTPGTPPQQYGISYMPGAGPNAPAPAAPAALAAPAAPTGSYTAAPIAPGTPPQQYGISYAPGAGPNATGDGVSSFDPNHLGQFYAAAIKAGASTPSDGSQMATPSDVSKLFNLQTPAQGNVTPSGGNVTPAAGGDTQSAQNALAKLYSQGGQALSPQALEGLTPTETSMMQGGGAALGADVQGFQAQYDRSRIGQKAAAPSVAGAG